MAKSKSLVIVESPAKARTIAGYLGDGFVVESSIGHIRDLPEGASQVPKSFTGSAEARRLGVDVDNDFKPLYVVAPEKRQQITKLKKLLKEADQLFLATDEDREGESIAWHLFEVLNPKVPVKRMVFHEITKNAIQRAIEAPREIDRRLVDAQEARRILDRLVGWNVSPVLWKKVGPKLSAGRVQSVATRIVVERERERIAFRSASYWDLEGTFHKKGDAEAKLTATLTRLDGKRLATGKDFGADGKVKREDVHVLAEPEARALAAALPESRFTVTSVERKPYTRRPSPPFMTSTLQQEAGRKLRFPSRRTMQAAQRLYENGYITYMRTDSTTLAQSAVSAARTRIGELYGADYVPAKPRTYSRKVKNAQEAHEAIRPAGEKFRTPESVAREVGPDEAKLYELIWKRTIASQMADARGETLQVKIGAKTADGRDVELSVSGRTILFPGFLRAYVEGSDDPEAELETREKHLPPLAQNELLAAVGFEPAGHETQPPARYTEASLVRRMEELGVGRPSTYASILGTIQGRDYVWKRGQALIPSFKAFAVITLLEKHFPQLVDYAFTARMEDDLDLIASGSERVVPWLSRFYFGPDKTPANENSGGGANGAGNPALGLGLKTLVDDRLGEIDARQINSLPLGEDAGGNAVTARVGRYGPYLERGEDKASIPEDLPPDELTLERAIELLEAPKSDRELGPHPETGETVYVKDGRFGPYVQLGEAGADRKEKPKTSSLFKSMSVETVDLETALKLLSLPREIGVDEDGEPVRALNGRYGPYVQKGKESRSLESEEQLFTLTMEQAKVVLAQPKRRGRGRAAAPLKEFGTDPETEAAIVLKDGRFGPYITDGTVNVTVPKGRELDGITFADALDMIRVKRERVGTKKTTKKKTAKKKTTKKKTAKKKATKKKAAAKTATKKTARKAASKKASGDEASA